MILLSHHRRRAFSIWWIPLFWPLYPIYKAFTFLVSASSSAQDQTETPDRSKLRDFDLPTAEEGRMVPRIYGLTRVAPNMIIVGNLRAKEIEESGDGDTPDVTTGYAYALPMVYAIGEVIDAFKVLYKDKDIIYGPPSALITASGTTFLARTGIRAPIGGSSPTRGTVKILFGTQTVADPVVSHELMGDSPIAYVGTSLMIMGRLDDDNPPMDLKGVFIGDNVQNVPPYLCVVRRINMLFETDATWPAPNINSEGSANPAHVIYDLLVNVQKTPAIRADADNFKAAATVFGTEGTGISFAMQDYKTAQQWIEEIERHCDCALYFDETVGKFRLKLIRDDFDPELLLSFDESDYRDMKLTVRTWTDVSTEFEVKYISRVSWEEVSTGWYINAAARDNIGTIKPETLSFTMFNDLVSVANAVARNERKVFYPLRGGSFKIPKSQFPIYRGFPFKLTIANKFTDLIVRVVGLGGEKAEEQTIEVSWLEDIWGIGDVTIPPIDPGDEEPPNLDLLDPVRFPFVKDAIGEMGLVTRVFHGAAKPATGNAFGYLFTVNGSSPLGEFDFSATGLMTAPGYTSAEYIDFTVGFTIDGTIDIAAFDQTDEEWQRGDIVMMIDKGTELEWELLYPKTCVDNLDGTFTFSGLIRNIGGTPIDSYPDNTRVWILPHAGPLINQMTSSVASFDLAADLSCSFAPYNLDDVGPEVIVPHEYLYRPETPYPVDILLGDRPTPTSIELIWIPSTRRGNNNLSGDPFLSVDSAPAHDSGREGSWNITSDDGINFFTSIAYYLRLGIATPQDYTVTSEFGGRMSAGRDITI